MEFVGVLATDPVLASLGAPQDQPPHDESARGLYGSLGFDDEASASAIPSSQLPRLHVIG